MTPMNDTLKKYVDQLCDVQVLQELLDVNALREGLYVLIENGFLDEHQIWSICQQVLAIQ